MNGLLHDHPLVELIKEISAGELSGALRLARERVRGVVYFDAGAPVFAVMNLRSSRLAECLRRWGAVAPEQLDAHLREGMTDEQAAAALVAAGALTGEALEKLRARQTTEALLTMLLWADGEWGFNVRVRLGEETRVKVDAGPLLVEAARKLPAEFVAGRLGDENEQISPVTPPPGGLALLPAEAFVLSRLDAPASLGELLSVAGLPAAETRHALYALLVGGFVRRARWLRALAEARAARETTASAKGVKTARDEAAGPAPNAAAKPSESEPADAGAEDEARDPREELPELFARSGAQTHYEVLGVARSARPEEVKRAYYALARRFHPDRFRRELDGETHARVETAFGRIAQAYEVLKDSATRAAYDLKVGAARPAQAGGQSAGGPREAARADEAAPKREPSSSRAPSASAGAPQPPSGAAGSAESSLLYRAEEKFQQGLAALQQDNFAVAARFLGEAALLVPRQARYRAYYGRALARDRQRRRQAEAELQAAVALDERNVSYRVMLAELYRDLGLRRRAVGELERALELDPKHAAARRLMGEVRGPN